MKKSHFENALKFMILMGENSNFNRPCVFLMIQLTLGISSDALERCLGLILCSCITFFPNALYTGGMHIRSLSSDTEQQNRGSSENRPSPFSEGSIP